MRVYKEIYKYELYKMRHELQIKNSRDEQGAWKDRALDGQLLIHDATTAQLWSPGSLSRSKLQDLNMQVQGSQNSPTSVR